MSLHPELQAEREHLCLPLDGLDSLDALQERVKELAPYVGLFKVGKETFTRFGPEAVKLVKDEGSEVFLDLKYHDIPATVKGAAHAALELGVRMLTVHASGGSQMLSSAALGVDDYGIIGDGVRPKVLGVTVLTSHDIFSYVRMLQPALNGLRALDLSKLTPVQLMQRIKDAGYVDLIPRHVEHLAAMSHDAGLDGIVCSAADLPALTQRFGIEFMKVTPGIAGPTTGVGSDQKRVTTPYDAIKNGSSILVVGRAITGPNTMEERRVAAYSVLEDMARARREISPM